jgi:hypothetical protein
MANARIFWSCCVVSHQMKHGLAALQGCYHVRRNKVRILQGTALQCDAHLVRQQN